MTAQTPSEQAVQKPGGLGITALILGILAIVFSIIPFINIIGIIVGIVGLVLGIVGIFKSHRVMSIVGTILSIVGLIMAFSINSAAVSSIDKEMNKQVNDNGGDSGAGASSGDSSTDTYEYRATGKGKAMVDYAQANEGGVSSSGQQVDLPWTKKTNVDADNFFAPTFTVSSMGGGGAVTCEIIKNGKSVAKQSASGEFGSATCSG